MNSGRRVVRFPRLLPHKLRRRFLVFFDWDHADLTVRARRILAEAATHALVPTADGMREPQNRRVEIILR